jgi:hypothetical protein
MTTPGELGALAAENARLRAVIAAVLKVPPYCLIASTGVSVMRQEDLHRALGLCTSPGPADAVCKLDAGHGSDRHVGAGVTWTAARRADGTWQEYHGAKEWWDRGHDPLAAWAAQRACCRRCGDDLVRDPELIGAWASAAGGPLRGTCRAGSAHDAVQAQGRTC